MQQFCWAGEASDERSERVSWDIPKTKKASPRKSQPLLTYEKHRVKITSKNYIKILFFRDLFACVPAVFSGTPAAPFA